MSAPPPFWLRQRSLFLEILHSWQGTVASAHQIDEQIICEKKLQKDDLVIVFYGNPQTSGDTYIIDFFH